MSRSRIALIVGLVVLGTAGYGLWRATRSTVSTDGTGSASRDLGTPGSANPATSSSAPPEPALPGAPPERDPRERPRPPPPDAAVNAAAVTHGLDELHGRIRDATATCFTKSAGTAGRRIAFRYRLIVAKQRARIDEPKIYEASFELGDSAACFEKQLTALDWELAMPDLTTPVEDVLVGEEL